MPLCFLGMKGKNPCRISHGRVEIIHGRVLWYEGPHRGVPTPLWPLESESLRSAGIHTAVCLLWIGHRGTHTAPVKLWMSSVMLHTVVWKFHTAVCFLLEDFFRKNSGSNRINQELAYKVLRA